jgi:hypothetical protein
LQSRLNRHDHDATWRALARNSGVSEDVARLLWARAEADAANDPVKMERTFRRMLDEAKAIEALATELDGVDHALSTPGKWTRVLAEDPRPANPQQQRSAELGSSARLRETLTAALASGEAAVRSVAASDATTITEAIRRLRGNQDAIASIQANGFSQILKLGDALVSLVQADRSAARNDERAGKQLPTGLRSELETRIGADFGDVRVHDDPEAAAAARRHDAVAFAQGKDVYFADGKYDPSSPAGRHLIAHELTHVAQQRGASEAAAGAMSQPGSAVEREADRVAAGFAAGLSPGASEFAVSERASAGTISRQTAAETDKAEQKGPKEWKINLLGQVLDLSSKIAALAPGGTNRIDVNQTIGPLRIESATFEASADKVTSGTLKASIDSGMFHGTSGTLTVNSQGNVSGTLSVPINVPGLFVKQVDVNVGAGAVATKVKIAPGEFSSPDFTISQSDVEIGVTLNSGGVDVSLTGSAQVAIDNGMAQGHAKMDIALTVGGGGITFDATITGKISIAGLADADALIKYDGHTVKFEGGAKIPVKLPGLEGTANIHYEKGKLSLDSKDLHFTIPQLSPVMFDEVQVNASKLAAKFHLGSPVVVPLPGGTTLTFEQSSLAIDGTNVSGDITGKFALNNAGGLTGTVKVAYQKGGDITGSVSIAGGAKFTIGGVEVSIDGASKLDIVKGLGVNGDIAGSVKIPNIPEIAVHVVAKTGEPIDLTCSAHIPLSAISKQVDGDVKVEYHRGGGANAFSLEATNVKVNAAPINGQVLFSKLTAHIQGKQITGYFEAASGTVIKVGKTTTVTILGGRVDLKPNRILDGHLQARTDSGNTSVEAVVGWNQGKFDWSAEGNFDLGQLTGGLLVGQVHAAAGSSGTGNFVANGPITFSSPALQGIAITELSGDKEVPTFHAKVDATAAIAKISEKVPNVQITPNAAIATITYADSSLHMDGKIEGSAKYPKSGDSQLEGNFHLAFDNATGFTGTLDGVKLTASEYFQSQGGTADLNTGDVHLGDAKFSIPGVCDGNVTTAHVNLKSGDFRVEAQVHATQPALAGLTINVVLDRGQLSATLAANAPPIQLGDFGTLTVGGDTQIELAKGTGLTVHLKGAVDAHGLGTGTFNIDYVNKTVTGAAQVHMNPIAMFDQFDLDLKIDENRKISTTRDLQLRLAPNFQDTFVAEATVSVADNKMNIVGRVKEVKNLGAVSEAFGAHGGATITYDQASRKVTVNETFEVGGIIPQLATGSTLILNYSGSVFTIIGTLKPAQYGPVTFTPDSHITATWTSLTKRLVVAGEAHADIANLCKADFTVDAGLGGGMPGAFGLRGHIDATKLSEKFPGVTFSSVTADFSVVIGKGAAASAPLNFHVGAQISAIPAAGISQISASIDANYQSGQGMSGTLAVTNAKMGDVTADGNIQIAQNKFQSGTLHLAADFPGLKIEGRGTVSAGDINGLTTTADLTVTPGAGSALASFVQSGNIHVEVQKWKLTNAVGQLHLKPPSFLPLENPTIEIGYRPESGISATLSTQFTIPIGSKQAKGTFVAGYTRGRGLYAHIEFPITVPGFQEAKVAGDLDQAGIRVSATLTPKDARIVKQATLTVGYDFGAGFFIEGSITLKPSEELELVVSLRYDKGGFKINGITPNDKNATSDEHEVAKWNKRFPTIPLATVGVASLGLQFGLGVAAGYRMPKIKFQNPQLEGGLEALDNGGMPAFTFGGQIAMGAYISMSISVQIVGEIQLLIASCDVGIGAEIAARLNLELGADVQGRFAPNAGAQLQIDPYVGASLDLIASLIATLHAEVCWFTIVDKKWTLASANFAHIELGQFHPFQPVGLQIGGPGGTHLTNGLHLRDDAFDQIISGVKDGAKHVADDEANRDAREHVAPVLRAFKSAAPQFEQLPAGWEKGMTAAPVDFHSMFPVKDDEWNYYQDHADTAETVDPADAPRTPTERLAKAVGVTARKDPGGAGRLILAWRRAQIANKGVNPDTGVNVVEEREVVQQLIENKYQADLLEVQQKQKAQDEEWQAHVKKQEADFKTAEATHVQTSTQQKTAHDAEVKKTQAEWTEAQDHKTVAAKKATAEGVAVQPKVQEKAPPPPTPPPPPAPKPLAKPAPIPKPPPIPLPPPPEILPAVTLPALPSDPGVSVHAAAAIPPAQKTVKPESPGAKQAPVGGAPDPSPGTASHAQQQGGGGGSPMPGGNGSGGGGGARGGGGSTSAAPRPGPQVTAGPDGIISQQKTLDGKKSQLEGGAVKPGVLGQLPPGAKPGAPGATPGATPGAKPGATPAATTGAKPGATTPGATTPGATTPGAGPGGLDPTVQKVVEAGKLDENAYKQTLETQKQTYDSKVKTEDKQTEDEAKRLEKEAEEAKKRKEQEKAAAEAAAKGQADANAKGKPQLGPDGKPLLGPDGKPITKPVGPIGTRVPLDILGEAHTQYMEEKTGVPMVASTPTPVLGKLDELSGAVNKSNSDIKKQATGPASTAKAQAQTLATAGQKAATGDEKAMTEVTAAQQTLSGALKITWQWAKVSGDPAITGGSLDNPLLHPYYPTFKGRVATLSSLGHISGVEPAPFAESIWTKICKAVKAAHPMMTDPKAYSDFARGWLDMKSPEFQKAIGEFDHLGSEIAKACSSNFAKAKNFGFWSKDEGRALAEKVSDLTLETSAIGGMMDGLPTLDGKKAGWDPEVWGALSNAYATAIVPELLKGKHINVCVGAGVPAGNIWEAVESEALTKGLKGTKVTLESVTKNYAAAAKSKTNRKELDLTKVTGGVQGCVFVGDRAGAIAAADAYFKSLDTALPGTETADSTVSKHADGAAPGGWEGRVIKKMQSSEVVGDDAGHTYHLLDDGTAVTTSEPKKLDPATTAAVEKKGRDEGWVKVQALFATREMIKAGNIAKGLSNVSRSTVTRWLAAWVTEGKLFRVYSGNTTDAGGAYTTNAAKADASRAVNRNNRALFGYCTPAHNSSAGVAILAKGINAQKSLSPPQPGNFAWHAKDARYNSKRPSTSWTGDKVFPESEAILGHIEPPGCAGHFNSEGGYRNGKAGNRAWCMDPSNYWGPEHEGESSASGGKAERYNILLLAEEDCHPDFLNV